MRPIRWSGMLEGTTVTGEKDMDYPATFTMHTPSGPTHCCVKHARQLESLMRMLGAHTNAVKAPEGAECANCKNEAKHMPSNAKVSGGGAFPPSA